jgi:hypothetical protein
MNGKLPLEYSEYLNLAGTGCADCGKSLAVSFKGHAPYAFEGWFRLHSLKAGTIFSKAGEYSLQVVKQDDVFVLQTRRTGSLKALKGSTPLQAGRWTHVAVTYDGQRVFLYQNAVLEGELITHDDGVDSLGKSFQIGAEDGQKALDGDVRSFSVWKLARSRNQVWEAPWLGPGLSEPGLVAQYDFIEDPPADRSRLNPAPLLLAGAFHQAGLRALSLSAKSYADLGDAADLNPRGSNPYTVQAWIRLHSATGRHVIFANGDFNADSGVAFYVENGKLVSQRGTPANNPLLSAQSLKAGVWYNVATTYETQGTLRLYVDGMLEAAGTYGPLPDKKGTVMIGAVADGAGTSGHFQGQIQNVSIWTIGLAQPKIMKYMTTPPTSGAWGLGALFGFTLQSPAELTNGHAVTLKGGAALEYFRSPSSSFDSAGAADAGLPPAGEDGPAAPVLGDGWAGLPRDLPAPDLSWTARETLNDVAARLRQEFVAALPAGMDDALRQTYLDLYDEELRGALDEGRGSILPRVTYGVVAGEHVLTHHTDSGPVVIFHAPIGAVSASVVWWLRFLYTLIAGVLGLFGFASPPQSTCERVLRLLLNNQTFMALMNSLVGAAFVAASVVAALKSIYDLGFLGTVLKFLIYDAGWYFIFQFSIYLVSILLPGGLGYAYFLLKLAKLVVDLINLISQKDVLTEAMLAEQETGRMLPATV